MDYDYYEAVNDDVKDYIENNVDFDDFDDFDECREQLYDDMFLADEVTGNGSGSYTFNAYRAEEYLCHNWDLLEEACDEFGGDVGEEFKRGAETCDVTIRCYLLGQALDEVLDDMGIDEDYFEDRDNDEDEEE